MEQSLIQGQKVTKEQHNKLMRLLKELDSSDRALAAVLGVSDRTIRRWKSGARSPSPATVARLRAMAEKIEAD